MAAKEFLLPDPGEGIHEADILEIHVSPGDEIKDGDPLFTVETDKAVVEIPSSFDGEIVEIKVETGESVEVGSVLLTFESKAGAPTEDEDDDGGGEEPASSAEPAPDEEASPEEQKEAEQPEGEEQEEQEEADQVEPTGGDQRDAGDEQARSDEDAGQPKPPVPASPATRSLAKRLDVDLREVEGSGPDGRIEPEDVKAAAQDRETAPTADADEGEVAEPAAPFEEHGPVEWVDLRSVRRATARHMTTAWQAIPHVTHQDVADITGLEEFRRAHAEEIEEENGKLSITVFLLKAAAAALAEHPRFNSSFDAENNRLALKRYYNLGVAVDTEDGLVVPVIEDVDQKSIAELAVELRAIAARMREGDRSIEDMQGGTFTITNPGGIGGTGFNPIINHPEVAILGAARARQVPVVSNVESATGEGGRTFDIAPRLHLPLVLAFDHRVNDGADAARFMNTVKSMLEDFSQFVLRG